MNSNYFSGCNTLNEIKAKYRALAKEFHPDVCAEDTTAIMQAINTQYAHAIARAAKGDTNLTPEEQEAEILNAEAYKNAINAIINLSGITIELCGGWIWVGGNTYPHRQIFKANAFYFASVKKMWYFRSVEYKTENSKPMAMDDIRKKYGTQVINNSSNWQRVLAR